MRLREFDLHRGYRPRVKGRAKAANKPEWPRPGCGAKTATTAEPLRVAYSLPGIAEIESAFGNGELSYAKFRALARVANASTESSMLDFARVMTDSQVEEHCPPNAAGIVRQNAQAFVCKRPRHFRHKYRRNASP